MAAKEIYRPTMSSDVIFELVDILEQVKRTTGLSTNMRKYLGKLDTLAYEIGKGTKQPAYVQTGKVSFNDKLMEALKDSDSSDPTKPTIIIERRNNIPNYTPEQIEEAEFQAADHYAQTGERKEYTEFLPKVIPIENERRNANHIPDDDDLFKML